MLDETTEKEPVVFLSPDSMFVPPPAITLRDYFAAMAMQGLLASELDHDGKIQVSAYEYADRMLAERTKK